MPVTITPLIEISSAEYGGRDVTATARSMGMRDGFFYVGNLFGDPAPGVRKSLRIKYKSGKEYEDVVPERGMFVARTLVEEGIPSPGGTGFEVLSASYGADRWADLTAMAKETFKTPTDYYSITDHKGAWPCDPNPGIKKFFVVKFKRKGRVFVSSLREPDTHMRLLQPLFSVIIPTWNRAPFLKRCVGSVLGQDFDPDRVEVVVVDDGSTDDTPRVMAEICAENPRVAYARMRHTGCPGLMRNHGLAVTTGKYVALLDTDDKWKPRHLLVVHERFRSTGCMLLRTFHGFVKMRLEADGTITEKEELDFSKKLWDIWGLYPSCWAFDREILDKIAKPPFPTRRAGDDTFFWWDCLRAEQASGRAKEEAIEEDTVVYGLIIKGNNLTYELNPESNVYRDGDF